MLIGNGLLSILHVIFTIDTIRVLRYHSRWCHGYTFSEEQMLLKHSTKYRVALAFSWITIITEMMIIAVYFYDGIRDDRWSTSVLTIMHSTSLVGWYSAWIYDQILKELGRLH